MNGLKIVGGGLLAIVVISLFVFVSDYAGLVTFGFLAPRVEEVRRQTFEQSQTYTAGMVRDLESLQIEYIKGNKDQRDAMRAIVLHRFSAYPAEKLPPDLRLFYNQLREQN